MDHGASVLGTVSWHQGDNVRPIFFLVGDHRVPLLFDGDVPRFLSSTQLERHRTACLDASGKTGALASHVSGGLAERPAV